MTTDLKRCRQKINGLLARREALLEQVDAEQKTVEQEQQREKDLLLGQKLVQEIAEATQQSAHKQIASVVTRCLKAVFGEDAYTFKIKFSQKRGKTEAELLFCRDGLEADPTTAAGGGVVDVAAFGLRLACLILSFPRRRRLLVLDEPFRHLNGIEYQERVKGMLEKLVDELGLQVILVSDDEWLRIGKVIEL